MNDLNFYTSFIGGVLSFLSPCVVPLLPLYFSYLGLNNGKNKESIKLMCGFCLGILSVFVLLSIGIKAITPHLLKYQTVISLLGGALLIVVGLHQLGFIEIKIFSKDKHLKADTDNLTFVKAYLLGFIYSFSWTPCISPVITTIVTLSLSSISALSWLYIAVYGLGFTLPFIIVGLAFKKLINVIRKYQKYFNILLKAFAAMIIAVGIYMIYDASQIIARNQNTASEVEKKDESDNRLIYVDDIERYDQFGNLVKLSDYNGKYLLVTFSATWCGYCNRQEEFVEEYIENNNDIVPLVVMSDYINSSNGGISIEEFGKDKKIPILIDDGTLFQRFGASSYPSNMLVGPDGSIIAGFAGAITNEEAMKSVIGQAVEIYESR